MKKIDCSDCRYRKDKEFDGNIQTDIGRLVSELNRENMIGCAANDKIKNYADAESLCPFKDD